MPESHQRPEVHLYLKSRTVSTAVYHPETKKVESGGVSSDGIIVGSPFRVANYPASEEGQNTDTAYMLPDEQQRALFLVEELAAKRGYVLKVVDVAKTHLISQVPDPNMKGAELFPVLVVPFSGHRLEGPDAFTEEKVCSVLPAELETVRAFSYIKVRASEIDRVQSALLNFDEVKETHLITGDWDMLAILEFQTTGGRNKKRVLDFIVEKVSNLPGVEDTSTVVPELSMTKFPL